MARNSRRSGLLAVAAILWAVVVSAAGPVANGMRWV
jgi:hypothetical protein